MALAKEDKARLVLEYGKTEKNTGSTEAQVAILSERIKQLAEHFKEHKKDTNSRRSHLIMIGTRRKLLKYLQRRDLASYRELIKKLNLKK